MKAKQYSVSVDQLVYEYGSMVFAICRRMMQDEETACEAAQEIWLEVMKSLPSFQGRSKLSTWLTIMQDDISNQISILMMSEMI